MIEFTGRLLLIDIEGTTSNISFVHEVLFAYARREAAAFLAANSETPRVQAVLEQMAADIGAADFASWCPHPAGSPEANAWVVAHVNRLMDVDAKQTGLKQLQGMIWETGYADGSLRSHVFPDVPVKLREWNCAQIPVCIYSSGSVGAQKLFFAHTEAGDLTALFSGHYDTTIGSKREAASYRAIAKALKLAPSEILFLSDIVEELDAAREAGIATALALRPGNRPAPASTHPAIRSFDEIVVPVARPA